MGLPGKEKSVIEFVPKGGARLDVVLIAQESTGAYVLVFEAFPSKLGQSTYLNLRQEWFGMDGKVTVAPEYVLEKYRFNADGTLSIGALELGPVRDAIKAGKLEGVMKSEDDALITADTGKLASFVQSNSKLFPLVDTAKRIPDEEKRAPSRCRASRSIGSPQPKPIWSVAGASRV